MAAVVVVVDDVVVVAANAHQQILCESFRKPYTNRPTKPHAHTTAAEEKLREQTTTTTSRFSSTQQKRELTYTSAQQAAKQANAE